jgi:hypothetical protein
VSFAYISSVAGFPTGQASNTTVTAQSTSGSAPTTAAGATVGTVFETSTPGTYVCLITYTSLASGAIPWVHWSVNGVTIDDSAPEPTFAPSFAPGPLPAGGLSNIVCETGFNLPQSVALIMDMCCAILSGLPSGPVTVRDVNNTANRAVIVFDTFNNRVSCTLSPPDV